MKRKTIIIIITSILFFACLCIVLNKKYDSKIEEYLPLSFGEIGGGIIFESSAINFANNNISSKNVEDVIDELYDSLIDGCAPGYSKGVTSGDSYICNKLSEGITQEIVFASSSVKYNNENSELDATNVSDALVEISEMIPDCKKGKTKTNETSNSYTCEVVCAPPTNVSIAPDKTVSWTTNSMADSYKICVSSSGACIPNVEITSGSTYGAITDNMGVRTVYVASVCNGNLSSSASKSTTVYNVSLSHGSGISSVTGSGNYITGASVTLGAVVDSGFTFSNWSETTGGAQVSSINAYTSTINSDWDYTANATGNTYTVSFNEIGDQNFTDWSKTYASRFNISYDSSTNMNNISFVGASGWEVLYYPIETVPNTTYHFTFDYNIINSYTPLYAPYQGVGVQALTNIDDSDNLSYSRATQYLPTSAGANGSMDLTFTATGTRTYVAFNFGMTTDGPTINLNLGNLQVISSTKTVTYGDEYGTLPSKNGGNFNGWALLVNGQKQAVTSSTIVNTPGDHVLYAAWTIMSLSSSSGSVGCGGSASTTVTSNSPGTISCSSNNTSIATCSVNNTTKVVSISATGSGSGGSATITISQAAASGYNGTSIAYTIYKSDCETVYSINCECSGSPYHSPTNGNTCKISTTLSCSTWCNQRCKARYGSSYTGHVVSCSVSSGSPTCSW